MRYHPTLGVSYEVNSEDVAPASAQDVDEGVQYPKTHLSHKKVFQRNSMSRCDGSTGADLKYSHSQEMIQFGPEMCQNNSSMTPTMKHIRITECKRVEMKVGKALLASSGRLLAPPAISI